MLAKHYFGAEPKLIGVFCNFIRKTVDYTNELENLKLVIKDVTGKEDLLLNAEINNYIAISDANGVGEISEERKGYKELSESILKKLQEG